MSENGKRKLNWINNLAIGKRVYLLMLPGIILYTSLSLRFPETNDLIHDGCYFFYWLFFLLAGFACINFPALMDSLEKNRRISLTIAVLSIFIINYLRWNQLEPYNLFADWQHDLRMYLNKKHKVLDYINQAVYPFYILHQTVIIIVVYYVVQTTDTIIMKYLFTVIVSFLVTMSIYHLFIQPFVVTRFLFGMKPKKKDKKTVVIEPSLAKQERETVLAS